MTCFNRQNCCTSESKPQENLVTSTFVLLGCCPETPCHEEAKNEILQDKDWVISIIPVNSQHQGPSHENETWLTLQLICYLIELRKNQQTAT